MVGLRWSSWTELAWLDQFLAESGGSLPFRKLVSSEYSGQQEVGPDVCICWDEDSVKLEMEVRGLPMTWQDLGLMLWV